MGRGCRRLLTPIGVYWTGLTVTGRCAIPADILDHLQRAAAGPSSTWSYPGVRVISGHLPAAAGGISALPMLDWRVYTTI